jgi:hypothetical protein
VTEMEKPKGFEKWRVRNAQRDRRKKKRDDAKWLAARALERKLRGRERGHTGLPQIISHKTAERWSKQIVGHKAVQESAGMVRVVPIYRKPKNHVVVTR